MSIPTNNSTLGSSSTPKIYSVGNINTDNLVINNVPQKAHLQYKFFPLEVQHDVPNKKLYLDLSRKMDVLFDAADFHTRRNASVALHLRTDEVSLFFINFLHKIINFAHKNSKQWFGKQLRPSVIKEHYRSPIKNIAMNGIVEEFLNASFLSNREGEITTTFLDKDQNTIRLDSIPKKSKLKVLLYISGIWVSHQGTWGPNVSIVKCTWEPQSMEVHGNLFSNFDEEISEDEDLVELTNKITAWVT